MLKRIIFYPILVGHLLFSEISLLYEKNKYNLINQMYSNGEHSNYYLSSESDTLLFITMMLYVSLISACILLIFTVIVLKREEKIIIGFLLVLLSCFSIWKLIILGKEEVSIYENKFYEDDINNKVAQIQEKIVDLTSIWDVFRSEIFKDLYEHPEVYLTDVINLLSNAQVNDTQKTIAALSVQNLSLPKFLFFAKQVLNLREENKISAKVFSIAVFPPYDWNIKLQENYTNKTVIEFLSIVKSSSTVDKETQEYVEKIITGKALEDIHQLTEMGQLPILKSIVK
ncbi:MAG: hypothetical protein HC877_22780 [Thioploca sp.]|nr:hypothetical protein [Thioploca sp.]